MLVSSAVDVVACVATTLELNPSPEHVSLMKHTTCEWAARRLETMLRYVYRGLGHSTEIIYVAEAFLSQVSAEADGRGWFDLAWSRLPADDGGVIVVRVRPSMLVLDVAIPLNLSVATLSAGDFDTYLLRAQERRDALTATLALGVEKAPA